MMRILVYLLLLLIFQVRDNHFKTSVKLIHLYIYSTGVLSV